MLSHFFQNIFLNIIGHQSKNNDPISLLYEKLNSFIIKFQDNEQCLDHITSYIGKKNISLDLIDESLEKAIKDNNLPFVEVIYPYLKKQSESNYIAHQAKYRFSKTSSEDKDNHKSLFYYARIAMEHNRIELFDYFIQFEAKLNFKSLLYIYSPKNNFASAKGNLIEHAVSEEKTDYINILKHYSIFDGHRYLKEHLKNRFDVEYGKSFSSISPVNEKQINFVLDKIYYPEKKYNSSVKNYFSELLFEVARYKDFQLNSIDIIKNLVNRGANFSYFNETLNFSIPLGEEKTFNLVNLLIKDGFKDIDSLLLKSAQVPNNFSTIDFLLKKGANINLDVEKVDVTLYDYLKKNIDSKELFNDLSNNLNNRDEPIKSKKIKL